MDGKHDKTFQKIFREEKNIACFFDALFGFMYRCTDFYTVTDGRPPGFPPGISREILFSLYEKWKREKENEKDEKKDEKTSESSESSANARSPPKMNDEVEPNSRANRKMDCHNGASHDTYRWSQTIRDLEVVVLLPPHALEAKDLQVRLITREMQIKVNEKAIISGAFPHAIKSGDSIWFLEPGKQLNIHIEKASEGWWDRLLEHESPIDMTKLDKEKNLADETEDEQVMRIQELLWNQRLRDLAQQATDQFEKPDTAAD